jgi:hypothetical protein
LLCPFPRLLRLHTKPPLLPHNIRTRLTDLTSDRLQQEYMRTTCMLLRGPTITTHWLGKSMHHKQWHSRLRYICKVRKCNIRMGSRAHRSHCIKPTRPINLELLIRATLREIRLKTTRPKTKQHPMAGCRPRSLMPLEARRFKLPRATRLEARGLHRIVHIQWAMGSHIPSTLNSHLLRHSISRLRPTLAFHRSVLTHQEETSQTSNP